jgi:hypothetical protein
MNSFLIRGNVESVPDTSTLKLLDGAGAFDTARKIGEIIYTIHRKYGWLFIPKCLQKKKLNLSTQYTSSKIRATSKQSHSFRGISLTKLFIGEFSERCHLKLE